MPAEEGGSQKVCRPDLLFLFRKWLSWCAGAGNRGIFFSLSLSLSLLSRRQPSYSNAAHVSCEDNIKEGISRNGSRRNNPPRPGHSCLPRRRRKRSTAVLISGSHRGSANNPADVLQQADTQREGQTDVRWTGGHKRQRRQGRKQVAALLASQEGASARSYRLAMRPGEGASALRMRRPGGGATVLTQIING